jgi:hypothetical protein
MFYAHCDLLIGKTPADASAKIGESRESSSSTEEMRKA